MAKDYAKKFYSSKRWQDCRNGYAASVGYLCERCLSRGLMVAGKIVHHKCYVTPENIDNPDIVLNWENLEMLCWDCHEEEHERSKDKRRKRRYEIGENGELLF